MKITRPMRATVGRIIQDRDRMVRLGMRAVLPVTRRLRVLAGRICREKIVGGELQAHIVTATKPLIGVLQEAMTASHMAGRLHVVQTAAAAMASRYKAAGAYDSATDWLKRRLAWDESGVDALRHIYGQNATDVTRGAGSVLEEKARQAVASILEEGMHVAEGMDRMREAFDAAGVTDENPYLLETLVRTQTAMAYGAGQWNADQDPAVADMVCGYVYVTAGDMRVRETHAEMNGATAPKDHPVWQRWWYPNGFGCRCSCLELLD